MSCQATGRACQYCPWRIANQGKRHPNGWYTKTNLRRLWAGLRTGEAPGMTCHPTDPNNLVPDSWPVKPKAGVTTVECSGALLLVQRELRLYERLVAKYDRAATKRYRVLHPRGLTTTGAFFWAGARGTFAGTVVGGAPMPVIEDDPDVGYPDALPSIEEDE